MSKTPTKFQKITLLLSTLKTDRKEFFDRIRHIVEVKADSIIHRPYKYDFVETYDTAIEEILRGMHLSTQLQLSYENDLIKFERGVKKDLLALKDKVPFRISHSADFAMARLCYLVCRAHPPDVVVETGVAFGVTSAFILKALSKNNRGTLFSIDLPPLGQKSDEYVGILIPNKLRDRWRLLRGTSRQILPHLVEDISPVNMFIHDSLHTYWHMLWEFNTITPSLDSKGIIISDDISENRAFQTWIDKTLPTTHKAIRKIGNDGLVGFAQI